MNFLKSVVVLLCFNASLFGANIVFDLHGVLLNISHISCMRQLPLKTIARYLATDAQSFKKVTDDWYSFLDLLDDQSPETDSYDPSGKRVPNAMTNNLKGKLSCATICQRAQELCATDNDYFRSTAHRDFMVGLTLAIFTPKLFIDNVSWFNDMIDLAVEYKQKGHKVFILSNLNDEHFQLLKVAYPLHINLFDGFIVSGFIHLAKPDLAIYQHLLTTFQLNSSETIFIDDQEVNCRAAETCGFTSIICPQKRSWKNLWQKQPNAVEAQRLINLALCHLTQ